MNQPTLEEYMWQYRQIKITDPPSVLEPKHVVRAHMVQLMIFAGLIPAEQFDLGNE